MKYILKNKEIELTDEELKEIVKQNSEPKGVEIKRWDDEKVIFTSTKQTIREAVQEAVSKGVSLEHADLSNADLYKADLSHADLYNADLSNADLSNANLAYADLSNANLSNANLAYANLYKTTFYGKGGTQKLSKEQVPVFLKALGFIIED